MDPITIGLIGGLVLILFVLIAILSGRKRKTKGEAQTEYIAALNFLIAGEKKKALEKFKSTVRLDTEYIDAYVKIGDIFRDLGAQEKSVTVHRDLLVRNNLKQEERLIILKSLAQDYLKLKQYTPAINTCDKIMEIDKNNNWAKDLRLKIYEEMGDWQAAFDLLRKDGRFKKREQNKKLAFYKVELGRQLVTEKREHDGRLRFREALKLNSRSVSAFLELADSYMREKRDGDALAVLEKFVKSNPSSSGLAFTRLKQVLFDLGHFSDIENIYFELAKNNPDIIEGHLGLAEIYEKKGELHKAIEACNRAIAIDSKRLDTKLLMLKLNSKLGRDEVASGIIAELANDIWAKEQEH